MKRMNVIMLTFTAMMVAILCVLAPFSIPLSKVPISMATFIVYLAGIILGTKYAVICVIVYLLIGSVGLPVFAGGASGIGILAGPTGGYLVGYLFIAFFTGLFVKIGKNKIMLTLAGMIIGTLVCYTLGTIWLGIQLSLPPMAALMAGVIPFVPGDIIKIVVSILVTAPLKSQLRKLHFEVV